MKLSDVTPLILTLNEESNIADTLQRLKWARCVVVVDSYSADETVAIANRFSNVKIVQRHFDNHVSQWRFGLDQIETEWVFTLDADYRCPSILSDEIRLLDDDCDAYTASFTYCINGKALSGTLYPPRAVLFRPKNCYYVQDGHTQLLVHDDRRTKRLRTKLLHDDRKPFSHWLDSQLKYVDLEVRKLTDVSYSQLGWKDRIRRWYIVAPVLTFFYCLFVKRLILDGRAGFLYTLQRVYAELLLGVSLLERCLRSRSNQNNENPSTETQRILDSDVGVQNELSHTRR